MKMLVTRLLVAILAPICWCSGGIAHAGTLSACVYDQHAASVGYIEYTFKKSSGVQDTTPGPGFLVSLDGYLITANHVISPDPNKATNDDTPIVSEKVVVRLGSITSDRIEGAIISRDIEHDLALLKIPTQAGKPPFVALPIGSSARAGVGETVTALGFPSGDVAVVPQSEITAANTYLHQKLLGYWQTGLSLNPGNSGGPVFGKLGTVIGIADAQRDDNAQAISYVVPIQYAETLLSNAGVIRSKVGPCADLPECVHPSHGIDHFEIDVTLTGDSGWRGGGYNQTAYCNDYLASLNATYPGSNLVRTNSWEDARWTGIRHREYKYFCSVQRQEKPIYKVGRGIECISD